MESTRSWIQQNCKMDGLRDAIQKSGLNDPKTQQDLKVASYILAAVLASIFILRSFASSKHNKQAWLKLRSRSPDPEKSNSVGKCAKDKLKPTARTPGTWEPSPFQRPTAPPYPNWSHTTTKPLPYRPFRWGPAYNVTMGLRTMHWNEWIELDNHYLDFHASKTARIASRGARCCRTDPDPRVWDGAVELLEELAAYLSERYPSMFTRTDVGVTNIITNERFDIRNLTLNHGAPEDPMQLAARLIQDDLAIMYEKPDGQYYLRAGAILLPGFWRLEDKFGLSLSDIHTSGSVPQFREKLEKGMLNFFRRVTPDKPVLRNNYFLQVDSDLAWSRSIGSEDAEEGIGWFSAEADKPVEELWFRSERQSLRRLPRSGGVVFTIRTYFHPVVEIAAEPYVPGRLASAVRSWGEDVSGYKGKEKYERVLLEYLDKKHAEQLAGGLDLEKEDEEVVYPW